MLAGHEALGGFDGHGRIAAIGIGANGLGKFLVERGPAHEHDVIVAHAFFLQVSITTFM